MLHARRTARTELRSDSVCRYNLEEQRIDPATLTQRLPGSKAIRCVDPRALGLHRNVFDASFDGTAVNAVACTRKHATQILRCILRSINHSALVLQIVRGGKGLSWDRVSIQVTENLSKYLPTCALHHLSLTPYQPHTHIRVQRTLGERFD